MVIDLPDGREERVASPTIVCCLPAVGINGHGAAQGIGSLTAADDGVGVPRVLVSRHSLESMVRSDAVARAGLPQRVGGYGHTFAFAGGDTFAVETSGRRLAVLERAADPHQPLTSTRTSPSSVRSRPKEAGGAGTGSES